MTATTNQTTKIVLVRLLWTLNSFAAMDSLLLAIAIGAGILAGYYILCGTKKPVKKTEPIKKTPASVAKKPAGPPKEYTVAEVALHNKKNDLWLIVEGRVFDVTSVVSTHPGGDAIMKYPGMDNTDTIFHDQHPESVRDQLNEFFIGTIKK
jgi:predicted heme/steroid binding protein